MRKNVERKIVKNRLRKAIIFFRNIDFAKKRNNSAHKFKTSQQNCDRKFLIGVIY